MRIPFFGRKEHPEILVIKPWKIAYGRVPKAANSSIKDALADALELPSMKGKTRTQDRYWRSVAPERVDLISPREFAGEEFEGYFCFSVVRHPYSRVVSCYKNKILRNSRLKRGFEKDGFRLKMSFDDFVAQVARTKDASCNVHLRSQAAMLTHAGRMLPELVVKFEELDQGWERIVAAVSDKAQVTLAPLKKRNSTEVVSQKFQLTEEQEALLRERYSEDFRLFYAQ